MRRLVLLLLLFLAAARARADEPARFFVERIDVRGAHHVSHDVIVAESRLRESHTYSELELREAAARVARAPYLLSADFALEKGSERGRFVLVIAVTETKLFFYRLDFVPINLNHARRTFEINDVTLASDNDVALGFRYFIGRRGEFHAGLEAIGDNRPDTADYASFVAGYTQYDVFGTRAFVTLNAKKPQDVANRAAKIQPQLVGGVALSINQTLTLSYDPTDVDQRGFRLAQRIATVRWSFNTTNHPLLPTHGTYLTIAPIWISHDDAGNDAVRGKPDAMFLTHDRSFGVEASANRWWELAAQNSVGAGLAGGLSTLRQTGFRQSSGLNGLRTTHSNFGTLSLNAAHSFWPAERIARRGDSRLQLDVKFAARTDTDDPFNFATGRARVATLSWIRRTSWGLVRLGTGYSW